MQIKLFFVESKSPFELLRSISDLGMKSTFPNIYVALKVIFTLRVTNCVVISIYLISQSLFVILSYNQILDLDGGPEKNRAMGPRLPLRRPCLDI